MVNIPPFEPTPGQANTSVFIDYMSGNGIKLSKSSTEKLPEKFDAESKGINHRANKSVCMDTRSNVVMIDDATGTPSKNIVEYGRLKV